MTDQNYGEATEMKIAEVLAACKRYGRNSIVALSGVPGTGKSFVANIAAQRLATDPLMVREIQFHPTFSYEEFIEGYRANATGGFSIEKGLFLEWNDQALEDKEHTYVLLIEELTRANMPSVLGELMTYIEYRERAFRSPYSRRPIKIATNLVIIATFNPRDRSALELDEALVRRLRILPFPPDTSQLLEMLEHRKLDGNVRNAIVELFQKCQAEYKEEYEALMPFGHGMFADIIEECPDLNHLWHHRLKPLLHPPGRQPHPFMEVIAESYPWKSNSDASISEVEKAE